MARTRKRPVYIDIFAGCGGLAAGLAAAGWEGLFAIEKDAMAFETLKYNLVERWKHFRWPGWLPLKNQSINTVLLHHKTRLRKLRGKVDLVVGGPPCQGFSLAKGRRNAKDRRNRLINAYIRFIRLVRPKILFFENVRGFTVGFKNGSRQGKAYSERVLNRLRQIGYKDVHGEILDFSEFGIPQRRKRFILVGTLNKNGNRYFKEVKNTRRQFLQRRSLRVKAAVRNAISDLERRHGDRSSPDTKHFFAGVYAPARTNYQKLLRQSNRTRFPDSHRFSNHVEETSKTFAYLLKHAERNKHVAERLKKKCGIKKRSIVVLAANEPTPTLTTHPDDYIHYTEPRILTTREYARIQGFSDWFHFKGPYTTGGTRRANEVPRYTQVGNAIPPLFGELSGLVLKRLL